MQQLARILSGLVLAVLVLSGCVALDRGLGGIEEYDAQTFGMPDPPAPRVNPADYRIGPLDELTVTIFEVEDLSGDHRVDPRGMITLPLIGDVGAEGFTATELARDIEGKYATRYLRGPRVLVAVKEAANRRVTVEGSVRQPGVFALTGSTTLLQAIALARGMDEYANPGRVIVFRQIAGQRQAAGFNVHDIRDGDAPDPELYANDIVVVDGSRTRRAYRELLSSIPLLAIFNPF